jgi:pilus assembly protein Flp/PilA
MAKMLSRLMHDTSGATAVEYGLMLGLIAVAIIAAVSLLGTSLRGLFEDVALSSALGGS